MKKIIWEKMYIDDQPVSVVGEDDEEIETEGVALDTGNGIVLLNDSLHPLKQYNLWTAHTNFWVTEKHFNWLRFTDGVEVVQVMSPYRFILAPGKAFDEDEVKRNCELMLGVMSSELKNIVSGVEELRDYLQDNFERWAIYVWPNGEYEHVTGNSKDFDMSYDVFKECQRLSSGMLLSHENKGDDLFDD